jgi:hypothetical protein
MTSTLQVRRKLRNQINLRIWVPIDREILALDEAKLPKSIEHRDKRRRIARAGRQGADAIGSPCLLGYRCERPRHRRTTDQRDEIAPSHGLPFNGPERTLAQLDANGFCSMAKQAGHGTRQGRHEPPGNSDPGRHEIRHSRSGAIQSQARPTRFQLPLF